MNPNNKLIEEARKIFIDELIRVDKNEDVRENYLSEYYKYELKAFDKAIAKVLSKSTEQYDDLHKDFLEMSKLCGKAQDLNRKHLVELSKQDKQIEELKEYNRIRINLAKQNAKYKDEITKLIHQLQTQRNAVFKEIEKIMTKLEIQAAFKYQKNILLTPKMGAYHSAMNDLRLKIKITDWEHLTQKNIVEQSSTPTHKFVGKEGKCRY